MREHQFTTFQELNRHRKGRDFVLFGAGNISEKTRRFIPHRIRAIIDNNANLWNSEDQGLKVVPPSWLQGEEGENVFVVICTTSFGEVASQLEKLGLRAGMDFVVSPILNDLRIIYELQDVKTSLLFTSGTAPLEDPRYGGGVYALTLDGGHVDYHKVSAGKCYGLVRWEDKFAAVNHHEGLIIMDADYEVVASTPLPVASSPHGIAFSETTGLFYVVASYLDAILVYNTDLRLIDQIPMSNKRSIDGVAAHHCNDVFAMGNSLYVTMFSYTGNWRREVFDGVVLEIEIPSNQIIAPLISDLWMPHNIGYFAGSLTVLESLRGRLLRNNFQVAGEFPGFSRGMAYDGVFFYVGQSRNRNSSKTLGSSNNISIDTSIIIFDEQTKVSRSIPLPSELSEVHSIVIL